MSKVVVTKSVCEFCGLEVWHDYQSSATFQCSDVLCCRRRTKIKLEQANAEIERLKKENDERNPSRPEYFPQEPGVSWDMELIKIQADLLRYKSEVETLEQWRKAGLDVLASTDGDTLNDAFLLLRNMARKELETGRQASAGEEDE